MLVRPSRANCLEMVVETIGGSLLGMKEGRGILTRACLIVAVVEENSLENPLMSSY